MTACPSRSSFYCSLGRHRWIMEIHDRAIYFPVGVLERVSNFAFLHSCGVQRTLFLLINKCNREIFFVNWEWLTDMRLVAKNCNLGELLPASEPSICMNNISCCNGSNSDSQDEHTTPTLRCRVVFWVSWVEWYVWLISSKLQWTKTLNMNV